MYKKYGLGVEIRWMTKQLSEEFKKHFSRVWEMINFFYYNFSIISNTTYSSNDYIVYNAN